MNKNKIIAFAILLAVFFGPVYRLFIYHDGNEIFDSAGEIFLMLGWIFGIIAAFFVGVNEPFGRKNKTTGEQKHQEFKKRQAA